MMALVSVLGFMLVPSVAAGQTPGARFRADAAAGLLVNDKGNTVSAAFAYAPARRLELVLNVERIHVPFQRHEYENGFSVSRGGTLTFVSGDVRFVPVPEARVSPFVLVGGGAGQSRPNVNDEFSDPVTNALRVMYAGGGVRVPFGRGLSVSADARVVVGLERDVALLMIPIRAGVAWSF